MLYYRLLYFAGVDFHSLTSLHITCMYSTSQTCGHTLRRQEFANEPFDKAHLLTKRHFRRSWLK